MKYIDPGFGYNTVYIGSAMIVFTGRIRVKAKMSELKTFILKSFTEIMYSESTKGCVILSYATIDKERNQNIIEAINMTLAEIMHKRIDEKYSKKVFEEYDMRSINEELVSESIDLRKYDREPLKDLVD